MLPTQPPMTVEDVLDKQDGIYLCIKDHNSVFLWVNDNFARLVGQTQDQLIGHRDSRAEHVAHDQQVMASGKPLLNFHETIPVPTADGGTRNVDIVTQKGLLRERGGTKIIGITVCFSLRYPEIITKDEPVPVIVPSERSTPTADDWIRKLDLTPTQVGGYFASTAVSNETIPKSALPERFDGPRDFYSANYYLLQSPDVLMLHSLNQDELWFHHTGHAIRLHIFASDGVYSTVTVGKDFDRGERLQAVAPHNTWFGAEVVGEGYGLVGCSLSPGYNAKDSVKPSSEQIATLKAAFPEQAAVIDRLTGAGR